MLVLWDYVDRLIVVLWLIVAGVDESVKEFRAHKPLSAGLDDEDRAAVALAVFNTLFIVATVAALASLIVKFLLVRKRDFPASAVLGRLYLAYFVFILRLALALCAIGSYYLLLIYFSGANKLRGSGAWMPADDSDWVSPFGESMVLLRSYPDSSSSIVDFLQCVMFQAGGNALRNGLLFFLVAPGTSIKSRVLSWIWMAPLSVIPVCINFGAALMFFYAQRANTLLGEENIRGGMAVVLANAILAPLFTFFLAVPYFQTNLDEEPVVLQAAVSRLDIWKTYFRWAWLPSVLLSLLGAWASIVGFNHAFPSATEISFSDITTIRHMDWGDWGDSDGDVFRVYFLFSVITLIVLLCTSCLSCIGNVVSLADLRLKLRDAREFMLNRNPGDPLPHFGALDDDVHVEQPAGPREGDPNNVALDLHEDAFPREGGGVSVKQQQEQQQAQARRGASPKSKSVSRREPEPQPEPEVVILEDAIERKYDDDVRDENGDLPLPRSFDQAPSQAKFSSAPSAKSLAEAQANADAAKDKDADDDENICVICCEQKKDTAFLPCAHYCVCFTCANKIMKSGVLSKTCPVCREPIEAISRFK